MKYKSVYSLAIILSILLIIAIALEIFLADIIRPTSLFGYIFLGTVISGVTSTFILESLDAKLTR